MTRVKRGGPSESARETAKGPSNHTLRTTIWHFTGLWRRLWIILVKDSQGWGNNLHQNHVAGKVGKERFSSRVGRCSGRREGCGADKIQRQVCELSSCRAWHAFIQLISYCSGSWVAWHKRSSQRCPEVRGGGLLKCPWGLGTGRSGAWNRAPLWILLLRAYTSPSCSFLTAGRFPPFPQAENSSANSAQPACSVPATQRKMNLICLSSSYTFLGKKSDLSSWGPEATPGPVSCCRGLRSRGSHRATPAVEMWMVELGEMGSVWKKKVGSWVWQTVITCVLERELN